MPKRTLRDERRRFGVALALLVFGIAALPTTAALAQSIPVPFTANNVALPSLATQLSYTVDMSTLPRRPRLKIEAVPDAAHANMELEVQIESCNLTEPNPFLECPYPITSTPNSGTQNVEFDTSDCAVASAYPAYVGETCQVKIRALSFGSGGAPATVNVAFSAATEVPSSTVIGAVTTEILTTTISATRATTFYQSNTSASNGAGDSVWVSSGTGSNALHGALYFDVAGNIPAGATIVDAEIRVNALASTGSPVFQVFPIPRSGQIAWVEGTADAAGDESTPPTPVNNAASWSHRRWSAATPTGPWSTPGGDSGPFIEQVAVPALGERVIQNFNLTEHVRALATDTTTWDGLLLLPVSGGVRLASDENPNAAIRPRLVIDYASPPQGVDDLVSTETAFYTSEGQNFRWIYDTNDDQVLITAIQGRCTWSPPGGFLVNVPYTYQYQGNPTYSGLDCCTWQIQSTTGVTGTGQAIFFINLDSNNPANFPPDTDADGIRNLCDNCPTTPNGPLLGTCLSGSRITQTCRSDQDCLGSPCSLAQDDADRTLPGDACPAPEPASGAMLVTGLAALGLLERRRTRRAAAS